MSKPQSIYVEPQQLDINDLYNSELFRSLNNLFKKEQDEKLSINERASKFFDKVVGLEPVKIALYRALIQEERGINVLLHGPPASGKSVLLSQIESSCNKTLYVDATNLTGAGLIELLYNNQNIKVLLIDELAELKKNDLDSFRSLLQTGRIVKTLKTVKYDFTIPNLKIIGCTNNINKLSAPLKSRFITYLVNEYTDLEIVKVVQFCLTSRNIIKDPKLAEIIALTFINYGVRNVRKIIAVSSLIHESDTIEHIKEIVESFVNNTADHSTINFNTN
jgi:Holliday junction resolvasome RuvABC ATP-dependent DNA helicase subunit